MYLICCNTSAGSIKVIGSLPLSTPEDEVIARAHKEAKALANEGTPVHIYQLFGTASARLQIDWEKAE